MPWGRQSRIVSVVLGVFNYGFRTTCRQTTSTTLGHVNAITNGVLNTGTILGCNSPKPGRASKAGTGGTNGENSFYKFSERANLLQNNWDLTLPNYSAQRISTPQSKLVKVGLQAGNLVIKFGWRMDIEQYNVIADARAGLGIEDVGENDLATTCFGINKPRPKRVRKYLVVSGAGDSRQGVTTTFVDQAKENSLPDGWALVGQRGGRVGFNPGTGQPTT